jgi:hypothetical protein
MRKITTCAALAIALLAAPVAWGKPDHGNKGGNGNHGNSGGNGPSSSGHDDDYDGYGSGHEGHGGGFSTSQRSSYADWYHGNYREGCPPGLAKKHNGCMPPGLAKKRYVIGHSVPHGVVVAPCPPALAVVLGPPPSGYRYGLIDGDVVKLAVGTALVVDAIQGLATHY